MSIRSQPLGWWSIWLSWLPLTRFPILNSDVQPNSADVRCFSISPRYDSSKLVVCKLCTKVKQTREAPGLVARGHCPRDETRGCLTAIYCRPGLIFSASKLKIRSSARRAKERWPLDGELCSNLGRYQDDRDGPRRSSTQGYLRGPLAHMISRCRNDCHIRKRKSGCVKVCGRGWLPSSPPKEKGNQGGWPSSSISLRSLGPDSRFRVQRS